MKKVALITWYHYRNYGTALQAVALAKIIESLGYETNMIQYIPPGYHRSISSFSTRDVINKVKRKIIKNKNTERYDFFCDSQKNELFSEFLQQNIVFTDECKTKSDFECLNNIYDAFVCGSDQIWSPLIFNPRYYLDFVVDSDKKVAYAPSLGTNKIEDIYVKKEIKHLLDGLGSISVREKNGQNIIQKMCGRKVEMVLDPTLLLTKNQWCDLLNLQNEQSDEKYLLVYMLGNNEEHWKAIYEIAEYANIHVKVIPVFEKDLEKKGCVKTPIGPKEFIQLIDNATFVCTDSFHGMIFSCIFHKQFIGFKRFQDNDIRNQNPRIYNLLDTLNLSNRLFDGKNHIGLLDSMIDYADADRRIDEARKKSIEYLKNALSKATTKKINKQMVVGENKLCCGCGMCKKVCSANAISIKISENGFYQAVVDKDKCINCGKCQKVCPFVGKVQLYSAAKDAEYYSFKCFDDKVLSKSTSGGAAYCISKLLVKSGYTIVACQYNKELQRAEHIVINDEAELDKTQGSKYIQSEFSLTFNQIENNAKPLAVFGTPCQIAAFKKLFSKNRKVIGVDLICHGVPSLNLYKKYQEYIGRKTGIDAKKMEMFFRYKPKGWATIHLAASDGKSEYCESKEKDPFFRLFEVGNCYNETCYECRWRRDSEADIRLGDYWGNRFKDDLTGVSMVIGFSESGKTIINNLQKFGQLQLQSREDYYDFQQGENYPKPVYYDSIMSDLKGKKKIESLVTRYAIPNENKELTKKERLRYTIKVFLMRKS